MALPLQACPIAIFTLHPFRDSLSIVIWLLTKVDLIICALQFVIKLALTAEPYATNFVRKSSIETMESRIIQAIMAIKERFKKIFCSSETSCQSCLMFMPSTRQS